MPQGGFFMKQKRFWLIRPLYALLILMTLVLWGLLFLADWRLFLITAPFVIVVDTIAAIKIFRIQQDLRKSMSSIGKMLSDSQETGLLYFPMPVLFSTEAGEIVWYNEMFRSVVLHDGDDIFGYGLSYLFPDSPEDIAENGPRMIGCQGGFYQTFCMKTAGPQSFYAMYFVDVTRLENKRREEEKKRPVILSMLIDNYEETINREPESNKLKLLNDVRNTIQEFADKTSGFIRRVDHDRYVMVVESQDLDKMRRNRFQILDQVRMVETENRTPVTLSIGVSRVTDNMKHAENEARQALEMALGRGGDQVAIKTDGGYEFFGGFSKGVEKQTKVKTRIVASALAELVKASSNVLVMGHKFADLDALGSAIGMAKAVRCLGKNSAIVLDSRRNLADVLVQRLVEHKEQDLICLPDVARDLVNEKTLLIIVDTHTQDLIESPAIYEACKQVVVIDHHRKMVNHIQNAVIFYHEPFASSASEMVTELIQYLGDACRLGRMEAEALLAGIMLDTKSFVVKTGVRTFEAAAYLRRLGADTVSVNQLFASTIESYRRRTQIVSNAEIVKGCNCAISVCDFAADDMRVIAPQAADELLNINGVKASFVLYQENGNVNISARSMGAFNVQVIMEQLGGGGHHTMAGAQIKDTECHLVRTKLAAIIEEYVAEQEKKERKAEA